MRIGLDAKRIFRNGSGLGEYGRNLARGLHAHFPLIDVHLYTPKLGDLFPENGFSVHMPSQFWGKKFPSGWRTKGIVQDLKKDQIQLYHGLSNEIPMGLKKAGIKSVVTIHDLIFLHFPHYYPVFDVAIYRRKFAHAIREADHIIAISEQTRQDILAWQPAAAGKVSVVYQGCRPAFYETVEDADRKRAAALYGLKPGFVLAVGAGNPRKNLEILVDALAHFVPASRPQLVIVAGNSRYQRRIRQYVMAKSLANWVVFLENVSDADLPALYHSAGVFAFPSVVEGFGVPLLEAMAAGAPIVACDNVGFHEVCGQGAVYASSTDSRDWAAQLQAVLTQAQVREAILRESEVRKDFFKQADPVGQTVEIYRRLLDK